MSRYECPICEQVMPLAKEIGVLDLHRRPMRWVGCSQCEVDYRVDTPSRRDIERYVHRRMADQTNPYNQLDNAMRRAESELTAIRHVGARTILDWGSGAGHFARLATGAGLQVTAVEPVRGARRRCAEIYPGLHIESDWPHRGQYDAVCFWHSLAHEAYPLKALRRALRLLSPTGAIVISEVELEGLLSPDGARYHQSADKSYRLLNHRWLTIREGWVKLFNRAGLSIVEASKPFPDRVLFMLRRSPCPDAV